jgi:hypothetical protein
MTLMEQNEKQLDILPPEKQSEVLDFILFLQQRVRSEPLSGEDERAQRIRSALITLAELNTFAQISDLVAWQKEIRQDRKLPGRS